ncbi:MULTISPECIES: alpha/beta hydrolase [Klebsiella]|uniref:alpha/beta hydrolase n=1 Tax=Klebsiella TaxID=570 RepID=UPI0007CC13DD|nr:MULTISPECIES: alpha/beta hydrolase-fold protein [Klebsiella]MBW5980292.1 Salmochelin siderophore protein IroE [Klebsiella michiganensis]RFP47768.1 alpha/beta hydrolase [Klebsiella oxytoca]MBD0902040.1 alpha/beta hydrolase [Klebsiella grimontii]MBM1114654.1 alpha/beta hydrolase [Klebsiella grimontii]MBW5981375.1 Salmochelin siderophore protein IroE [Klebsiella michiganensis]
MLIRKFYSAYPPKGRIFIAALVCAFYGINADAKPDMRPLGPNIADRGSAYYHFNVAYFDSLDGERHYKVWTAIPNAAPPAEGYPILYALDGNAVMDRVSDSLLAQLTQKTPPVIVAVGYQTTLPFDQNARAYDYRPTVKENSADSGRDSRKSGGSEAFRQLLQNTIVENVERGMKIDPRRRAIWGHSYGGLFIIDSWLASSRFRIYFSASPSLGRGNASLLDKMAEAKADAFSQKSLYLMEGAVATQRVSSAGAEETRGNVLQTVSLLKKKGVAVNWWPYPGLSHGEMFNASLQSALLEVADGTLRRRPAPAIR